MTAANINNYHVREATTPNTATAASTMTPCTFTVFALPLSAVLEARRRRDAAQRRKSISKIRHATIPSHERQALREALKEHLHQSR
ncbi:hypothetical protein [Medusavirus stheno T3]|uniref:Uncharacterized protein n=1 Tax=Medusavirus stheno T3 TaxID=3069717 RepID=A0A7S7YEU8_9VIRU|nr:hypothetical protein QKU73_gp267 [Acanthamoeba castellanii medusavirus]QPB44508.1 hypothetical protein [Medusavirus stheno T3]